MIYLRRGDRLPAVAMAQRVINISIAADARLSAIQPLAEDGMFGGETQQTVTQVAQALNVRGRRAGVFDNGLWTALKDIAKVRIVDVIDLCVAIQVEKKGIAPLQEILPEYLQRNEPDLSPAQRQFRMTKIIEAVQSDATASRAHYSRLLSAGGQPIALNDRRTPFATIASELQARSRDGWQVGLVRMQGHGSPGSQGIAGSVLGWNSVDLDDLVFEIDDTRAELDRMVRIGNMMQSTPRWSCVELHGCKIAASRNNSNGPDYVREWAQLVQRPVSGGVRTQDYGSSPSDYRIEGRVITHVPGGSSIGDYYARNH